MNCKRCGAVLVSGQIICSNCNFDNSINNIDINSDYINNDNYQSIDQFGNEQASVSDDEVDNIKPKQNIFLKIGSIISLIAGIGMVFSNVGNLILSTGLNRFDIRNVVGVIISVVFVFYALLISNFNLGKNKIYDNKVLFICLLILNLIFAFMYKIYFLVFIFSLIGFITSINKNKE